MEHEHYIDPDNGYGEHTRMQLALDSYPLLREKVLKESGVFDFIYPKVLERLKKRGVPKEDVCTYTSMEHLLFIRGDRPEYDRDKGSPDIIINFVEPGRPKEQHTWPVHGRIILDVKVSKEDPTVRLRQLKKYQGWGAPRNGAPCVLLVVDKRPEFRTVCEKQALMFFYHMPDLDQALEEVMSKQFEDTVDDADRNREEFAAYLVNCNFTRATHKKKVRKVLKACGINTIKEKLVHMNYRLEVGFWDNTIYPKCCEKEVKQAAFNHCYKLAGGNGGDPIDRWGRNHKELYLMLKMEGFKYRRSI